MKELPEKMTMGECYEPAMKITNSDEAEEYLKALIERCVKYFRQTPEEAERIQKENLGYFSGYYDTETMVRVQKLFKCAHPIFGKIESQADLPTPEEALAMGKKAARGATP